jgi:hypothetical protein
MTRRGRFRGLAIALAVALGGAALASLAPVSPAIGSCAGAGPNHAALVIQHGDGSVVTRCVAFETAQITGQQLLDSSGVAWVGQTFGGFGTAACAIDGEPAHYSTCPGKDYYWAIFVSRGGGTWQFAASGISGLSLSSGDAEGFRYVPAAGTPAAPPAPAGVCATAGATTGATAPGATATGATATGATAPPGTAGPASRTSSPAAIATSATPAATGSAGLAATLAQAAAGSAPAGTLSDSPGTVADVAAGSAASAAATPAPGAARSPAQGGGLDLGLLLAAVVGGALAGLALLRLVAGRRGRT